MAVVALGLASAPALAADPFTEGESVRAMHHAGACVVQYEVEASRVLGMPPGSEAERALFRLLSDSTSTSRCIGGPVSFLTFQPQLLRGAIAEAVLEAGDGGAIYDGHVRWVAPFTGLTEGDIAALGEQGRGSLRALDFAQCVHAAAREAVAALLETVPTSRRELRAFERLTPYLGPCLPAGARMTVVRPQLRAFLAEAAYREAYTARHSR